MLVELSSLCNQTVGFNFGGLLSGGEGFFDTILREKAIHDKVVLYRADSQKLHGLKNLGVQLKGQAERSFSVESSLKLAGEFVQADRKIDEVVVGMGLPPAELDQLRVAVGKFKTKYTTKSFGTGAYDAQRQKRNKDVSLIVKHYSTQSDGKVSFEAVSRIAKRLAEESHSLKQLAEYSGNSCLALSEIHLSDLVVSSASDNGTLDAMSQVSAKITKKHTAALFATRFTASAKAWTDLAECVRKKPQCLTELATDCNAVEIRAFEHWVVNQAAQVHPIS